jgi:hypothetical protein
MNELIDNSNEISILFKQLEQTKKEDQLKRKNLQDNYFEEFQIILKHPNHIFQRKYANSNDKKKKNYYFCKQIRH